MCSTFQKYVPNGRKVNEFFRKMHRILSFPMFSLPPVNALPIDLMTYFSSALMNSVEMADFFDEVYFYLI